MLALTLLLALQSPEPCAAEGAQPVLKMMPAAANLAGFRVLFAGAVLGLGCYATYSLTNWAPLKQWSGAVAYVVIAWGAVLTAFACWIGVTVTEMI